MGILWRLLASKGLKKARRSVRRAAHPVRTVGWAISPRPVNQLRRGAFKVAHPLEAAEFAAENAVVGAVRGKRKRTSTGKRPSTAKRRTPANRSPGEIYGYGRQEVKVTWIHGSHRIPVVGLPYHQAAVRDTVKAVPSGGEMDAVLLPEPSNPHDPNAVAVYTSGGKVGYLPSDVARVLQPALTRLSAAHRGQPAGCPAIVSAAANGKPQITLMTDLRKMGIDPALLFYD